MTRSLRPECQQASVACRLVFPQLSTNWTATRRLCFSEVVTTLCKTKLPDGGERRLSAEETCAPWPAWRRSWRRRASTSTCCREPCPAAPALEQGTRGSWSTGRIMKGQYNYQCVSTFQSKFKNEWGGIRVSFE